MLLRNCLRCGCRSIRITYDFPRAERERVRLAHIVGLRRPDDPFVQMMWEGGPDNYPQERWFDFKYMNGRSNWGLNKPAIIRQDQLRELFDLYRQKTGKPEFP